MKHKLLKDQYGVVFILELFIILIVFSVIGFVGFKAYTYQQKTTKAKINLDFPAQNPTDLPQAHNAFGFNVLKALSVEEDDKNIFISPSSLSMALSMVYNGADGETKSAITKALEFQKLDITKVNQESLGLINSLKNPDDKVELSIANSVWIKNGIEVKPTFLDVVGNYYKAEATTLDFDNPSAKDTINSWVNKNTKGKIPSIVDNTSDKVMYLINATYFKGSWTTEFDKKLTQDKKFTPTKGSPTTRPFMKQKETMAYLETDEFQSAKLPYGKNERLSMYVFLPINMSSFVNKLDINTWNKWVSEYQKIDGTILLPRFKLAYEVGLIPTLTKLGMGIAFQEQANFSGIAPDLFISEVKQKTYLDVNEEGTEAAAVTSVGTSITSTEPAQKEFYMEVNRPFFIAIRDNQTQEILFAGIIQNP
jgi:serine protease inhibitor